MEITEIRRESKGKEGHWIAFDYKKSLYEVLDEPLFKHACDLFFKKTNCFPICNKDGIVIEFKEID